jgi:hypothetical protein
MDGTNSQGSSGVPKNPYKLTKANRGGNLGARRNGPPVGDEQSDGSPKVDPEGGLPVDASAGLHPATDLFGDQTTSVENPRRVVRRGRPKGSCGGRKIVIRDGRDVDLSVSLVWHVVFLAETFQVSPSQMANKLIAESPIFIDHMKEFFGMNHEPKST